MPSPLGSGWLSYIKHRLKMFNKGIEVYTTDKYTRLAFEKYVESNRVCDNIAGMLTNHSPTLIHFGGAEMAANSPIGMKKNLRAPGNRRMLRSYRKCRGCFVNIVDEYYTSQTCGKCYSRFNRATRRNRFKICEDCRPDRLTDMLPSMIVTRRRKRKKRLMEFLLEQEDGENNENQFVDNAEHQDQPFTSYLHPKVEIYHKKWHVNPVSGIYEYVNADQQHDSQSKHKTVWHRDVVAAKCILIKGNCVVYRLDLYSIYLSFFYCIFSRSLCFIWHSTSREFTATTSSQ